jgi:hypothetical protein
MGHSLKSVKGVNPPDRTQGLPPCASCPSAIFEIVVLRGLLAFAAIVVVTFAR